MLPAFFRPAPLAALSFLLLASVPATSLTFDLTREFDGDEPDAAYATVEVTDNAGDLDFVVTLNGLLGSDEDAHILYFNVVGTITNPTITTDNAPTTPYGVSLAPSVAGGAGSAFDVAVSFGNGGGRRGNGSLTFATFTLSADQALTVADLDESSFTNGGIEAQIALHVQGTSTGSGSETIGGVSRVPEPSLALLALGGLLALCRRR